MQRVDDEFLLRILRACDQKSPLYPAAFAQKAGVERAALDQALDLLRTQGLVTLSDWVKGHGQGYRLTDAGKHAIGEPVLLSMKAPPKPPPPAEDESLREVIEFFEKPVVPYVTRTMLALNVLVFIGGMLYAPSQGVSFAEYFSETSTIAYNQLLRKMGALNSFDVFPVPGRHERPEIERMLLCNFLHVGLIHLLVNMWTLYNLGRPIEAMWGHFRFLVLYLVSGLVSAGFVLWHGPSNVLTAGASGVLFGLFAGLVVWFLLHRRHLSDQITQAWSRNIGLNMIPLVAVNFMPGVSWEGHLGGAIGGALAALCLSQVNFRRSRVWSAAALLLALSLPLVFYALAYRVAYH